VLDLPLPLHLSAAGPAGRPAARPLLVTADQDLLDDALRLAAAAGVELHVEPEPGAARAAWAAAPLVLVGSDRAHACLGAGLPRRAGVVLVGLDLDDAGVWRLAVEIGAPEVAFLPDAEGWLVDRLAQAVEENGPPAALLAVLGGRGGAGATTLAAALAVTGVRAGHRALLVDADPLGGGIDLVLGGEEQDGLRWPDLAGSRGRLPAASLPGALPRLHDLAVLSWDRGDAVAVSAEAVTAVLGAASRSSDLVVVDLPRSLDAGATAAVVAADTVLLLVPAEVRACLAAARVAAAVRPLCRDLRLVVRGPAPAGLEARVVAESLGLPLAGVLRPEPGLAAALERGEVPAGRGRGPLATFCRALLEEVVPARAGRVA
jgi:secretion/DNA translocation related CpaE-like protein